jgi:hypothetical protein
MHATDKMAQLWARKHRPGRHKLFKELHCDTYLFFTCSGSPEIRAAAVKHCNAKKLLSC